MAGCQDVQDVLARPMNEEREIWEIRLGRKKKKNLRERTRAKRNKFTGKPRRNKELLYLFMKKESRYVKQSDFSYF